MWRTGGPGGRGSRLDAIGGHGRVSEAADSANPESDASLDAIGGRESLTEDGLHDRQREARRFRCRTNLHGWPLAQNG